MNFLKRKRSRKLKKQAKRTDYMLAAVAVVLSFFGLLMIFEASSVSAMREFGDKFRFLKNQLVWAGAGLFFMGLASRVDYRRYYNTSIFLLVALLIGLVLVFLPGIGVKVSGAHRWINLGFFQLQPSELAKLIIVIYLSAWFTFKEKERFLSFIILLGLVLGLIIIEPDLGTAVIIGAIAVTLYFLSGAPLWQFGLLLPAGLVSVLGLAVVSPYRYRRLLTFLNPTENPLGASYHIRQLLLALGSGGWLGIGIGKSRQKFSYLPEATTDSIFAIVGEEFGFIGASIVILLYVFLIYRGLKIANNAPTRFGQLLGAGITSWFAIQTIINLGAMVALLPLTGVPLLFLSYGGSSLIVTFYAVGILLNISKQS
jgi:cell division protein FtsW